MISSFLNKSKIARGILVDVCQIAGLQTKETPLFNLVKRGASLQLGSSPLG